MQNKLKKTTRLIGLQAWINKDSSYFIECYKNKTIIKKLHTQNFSKNKLLPIFTHIVNQDLFINNSFIANPKTSLSWLFPFFKTKIYVGDTIMDKLDGFYFHSNLSTRLCATPIIISCNLALCTGGKLLFQTGGRFRC